MDVNAIWAPEALEALGSILDILRGLGYPEEDLRALVPQDDGADLTGYLRDRDASRRAIETWSGSSAHFKVSLSATQVRDSLRAKLSWLPPAEGQYCAPLLSE